MTHLARSLPAALVLGQLVGLLGWVDPVYLVLVLAGPVLTGLAAALLDLRVAWIALLWASAGLNMLWVDWLVSGEDQAYHLVLAVVMALLASAGWGLARLATRTRRGPAAV